MRVLVVYECPHCGSPLSYFSREVKDGDVLRDNPLNAWEYADESRRYPELRDTDNAVVLSRCCRDCSGREV